MAKATNPLLQTINSLEIFQFDCWRKYTTARKDGSHRVKFYCIGKSKTLVLADMEKALRSKGWKHVQIHEHRTSPSLTIVATPV